MSAVGKLDDNSPKLEFYMKSFLELQNGVRELTRVLHSSEAKYFNNGLLKNTDIGMIDFHNETNIGTREKQETKEESLISILPILTKLPR
ncbi:MAG: hypothetical protein ACRC6A_02095 [Fusobacteriaceae bacterium]